MNPTDAEKVLWAHLRGKQLGKTFLRQYIVGDYIVDFICRDTNLIIEVDGAYHSEPRQEANDALRTLQLTEYGYKVIRFTNEEVLYQIDLVLNAIQSTL